MPPGPNFARGPIWPIRFKLGFSGLRARPCKTTVDVMDESLGVLGE